MHCKIRKFHYSKSHNLSIFICSSYFRYPDQASHLIYLKKGRKYFMKATTKSTEESRDPQLSIGVVLPDDVKLFPISKTFMKDVSIEKTSLVSADTVERAENVRTKVMDKPKLFESKILPNVAFYEQQRPLGK